jgi:hypothetical protein
MKIHIFKTHLHQTFQRPTPKNTNCISAEKSEVTKNKARELKKKRKN